MSAPRPRLPLDDVFELIAGGEPEHTAGRKSERPRGYVPWAPRKKTLAALDQIREILDEYRNQWPITGRQILYRMMGRFGYSKDFEDRLYYILGRARRAKLIPFEAIRDDGVVSYSPTWYEGPEGFWDHVGREINAYRRDRQAGQRQRIELWCEAAGMAPQLARVASEFSVEVFTNGGGNSIPAVRQVVDRALQRSVPTVLLHVGDCDPYGESIFNALVEDAQAFLTEDRIIGTQRIEPVRVALTVGQVQSLGLPTQRTKRSKNKSKAHATIRERWCERYGDRTCQAEALAPDQLAKIVDQAIRNHLDLDRWAEQVEAEDRDQTALYRALPAGETT